MPLLHWSPRSPYVRKVVVALHERGLAEQVRTVRTHADPMIPHEPLMTINPLSKIPTLELDDGRVLFDSHVIATWIDQHGSGPRLFPHDYEQRLLAERDEALGDGILDFALGWLTEARLRPEPLRSSEMVVVYRRKLKSVTTYLDNHVKELAERPFDIGHLTLGVALCYLDFRFDVENWRGGNDRVAAWHAAFSERPAIKATEFKDDPRPQS
jgi:glutathione S-transferase